MYVIKHHSFPIKRNPLNLNFLLKPSFSRTYPSTHAAGMNSLPRSNAGETWRNPELREVIEFLSSPDVRVKAHAAAYLQHLSFGNDAVKAETRALNGIQPLIELLYSDIDEVNYNAVGALRNLSYGRKNDENKVNSRFLLFLKLSFHVYNSPSSSSFYRSLSGDTMASKDSSIC